MIERLTKVIYNFTGNQEITITPDTVLLADLGINSFQLAELVCELEDEFDIEIPDKSIASFVTIHDVIEYIKSSES